MGIELAGILGLVLLVPGFCMALAMRTHSTYGFRALGASRFSGTALVLILAIIIQSILCPLYVSAIDFFSHDRLSASLSALQGSVFVVDLHFNYFVYYVFVGYVLAAMVLVYLAGMALIWAVESGRVPLPYFHGAMYPIIKGKQSNIKIVCSVLTRIKQDDCYLMYKGTLEEIAYVSSNKLDYVALSDVTVFLMKIDVKNMTTISSATYLRKSKEANTDQNAPDMNADSDKRAERRVTYYSKAKDPKLLNYLKNRERFFIGGEDIANILFSRELGLISPESAMLAPNAK